MIQRSIGAEDLCANAVALGTWAIGGGPWWGTSEDKASVRAIQASIDAGVTLIDTAPVYGFGHSETVVGQALRGRRDQVVLASKCGLWWDDATGEQAFELEGIQVYRSLSPESIRREIEASLQRLGTDTIDLYQTHWPIVEDLGYRIDDTMRCLEKLRSEGTIRAIGASNVTVEQAEEYRAAGVLDVVQPKYSMLDRSAEAQLLPFCQMHGISTLVYSPLEQGLLTGRFGMDYTVDPDHFRNNIPWFSPDNRQRVLSLLEGWHDLSSRYHCTLAQLVIAWTVAQPGVSFALCGARTEAHALDNVRAAELVMDPDDTQRMRADIERLGSAQ